LATLLKQHRAAAAEELGIDEEEYQAEQDAAEGEVYEDCSCFLLLTKYRTTTTLS
jgi:hypothetical protein